jgi:hypothetical protein
MVIDYLWRHLNEERLWAQKLSIVCELLQKALDNGEVWLAINADKTTTVPCSKNRNLVDFDKHILVGYNLELFSYIEGQ